MAMVQCRECGQEVSTDARTCPHCGIADPAGVVGATGAHSHEHTHGDTTHAHTHSHTGEHAHTHAGHAHDHDHAHNHDHDHARKGGKAGWTIAVLLLLALLTLFLLWYYDVVNFV